MNIALDTYLEEQCECHPLVIFCMFYRQLSSTALWIVNTRKGNLLSLFLHKCIDHGISGMYPTISIKNIFWYIAKMYKHKKKGNKIIKKLRYRWHFLDSFIWPTTPSLIIHKKFLCLGEILFNGYFHNIIIISTYRVWTQSIGFPTYCRVVTAIENVTNKITVAFVCNRNIAESIFTWFICECFHRGKIGGGFFFWFGVGFWWRERKQNHRKIHE